MEVIIKESRLLRWLSVLLRRNRVWARLAWMNENILTRPPKLIFKFLQIPISKVLVKFVMGSVLGAIVLVSVLGAWKLVQLLWQIEWNIWLMLLQNTFITAFRVTVAVVLASVWTIPFGIWCGLSLKRVRVAQPIIQVLASFPAPMLYPLVLAFFFMLGINFHISSIFLLLMGVQWYILFSVLAGAIRIPLDLQTVSKHLQLSKWDRWTKLYLPSVFPAIITGWVTAAGGAWNASIVAEYFYTKVKFLARMAWGRL
jgi:NitT/TauT family transport system permease protein